MAHRRASTYLALICWALSAYMAHPGLATLAVLVLEALALAILVIVAQHEGKVWSRGG